MAKFKSNYPELGFYIKGERKQFANGVYSTESKSEISVLENLRDASEVKAEKPAEKPAEPKAEQSEKKPAKSNAKK